MRAIFLFVTIMSPLAWSASERCVTGDPSDVSLIKVFEDKDNPENEPIKIWRTRKQPEESSASARWKAPLPNCPDPIMKSMLEMIEIKRRNWSMKSQIRSRCIESAMATVGGGVMKVKTVQRAKGAMPSANCKQAKGKYICPTEAAICDRENHEMAVRAGSAPCVTPSMTKYIAWLINEGMSCFNPNPDDPIDPRTIFRKLNNESQFGFFVRNRNGVGVHQLVPIANKEMLAPERGYGAILEPVKQLLNAKKTSDPIRKRSCEPFRLALTKTPPQSTKKELPYGSCGLLQPGIGVARSIMIGLGTFSYISNFYKVSGENVSSSALVQSLGFDPSSSNEAHELRDFISLAYYSSAGIRGGLSVFKDTKRQLQCNDGAASKSCNEKTFLEAFKANMSSYYKRKRKPDYFNKIDRQYKGIVKDLVKDENEELAEGTTDLKGDLCIQ